MTITIAPASSVANMNISPRMAKLPTGSLLCRVNDPAAERFSLPDPPGLWRGGQATASGRHQRHVAASAIRPRVPDMAVARGAPIASASKPR